MSKFNIVIAIGLLMTGFVVRDITEALVKYAYADVAGMYYYDLKTDYDFKKAVKSIVESCSVLDGSIIC